ncbi:FAD-dependent monooxygenase [Muricoccus radiodurans]|uniref:FAD-dependent monooxygenase n=1 Tax=Muricoccus radiodurans TaxID=2231721 RepID=UPI003CEB79A3
MSGAEESGLYADRPRYPFARPPELDGASPQHPVAIVGGGPVGLTLALGLARRGVACTVIEARDSASFGSRACCISRRSLEIWDGIGVGEEALRQGLPWTGGRSFWRGHPVLSFAMPGGPEDRHPPMINLQQGYAEQILIDAALAEPLIDLRWHSSVLGLSDGALRIGTPEGDYTLHADWIAAADGARSAIRAALGLRLEGTSYEGRYLIADIRFPSDAPVERRAWFDPPSNPGSTVLMHRQPRDIWRIDYQLRDDEDAEAELAEPRVRARIGAHLAMIGEGPDYELVWRSLYRAHTLTLDRYRHGRVLFLGDAAHLVPIFGVRGLNSGIDDAHNFAWKLAAVIHGEGGDALLDSYSDERVFAARENIRQSRKSTLFMTPPGRGHALMRDAALSLAVSKDFARPLVNPRQTTAITYADSPLNTPEGGAWAAGVPVGAVLPNLPHDGGHLHDALGSRAAVLLGPGGVEEEARALGLHVVRPRGDTAAALGLDAPGAGMLVRPDTHLAWRWRAAPPGALRRARDRMMGRA